MESNEKVTIKEFIQGNPEEIGKLAGSIARLCMTSSGFGEWLRADETERLRIENKMLKKELEIANRILSEKTAL